MQSVVYYDYYDGRLCPIWYVGYLEEKDYTKDVLYVPVQCPFQPLNEFEESLGVSVFLSELIVNTQKPNCFGINIRSIRQRTEMAGISINNICSLVIQMGDLEEVLHMARVRWKTICTQ
ncbi:hypothetical protein CathTA2_1470 [Caldalkalibacillus thermarum TA2.A1]|uniref:Uncharacterized protein n=1 Tax=Caldalkalibacillus thermarum (strain TA2.A1) TaxID=986075 RepID=F5L6M0_CALTT|nr:hypothetical protein [Caldalkalibacillus thermarum]EGL83027.1 hypothetical protein CathTA2_1470 [Caldalkalibacillus thermarum TA2.A1]QZT33725.1 hypothetical protein HUR95_16120 [Caldalkalibacillus thermarum TA2.A1]